MASGPSAAVANQLRALFQDGTVGGLTDGQLLDRFVHRRDEAAFAALVDRHGPMVLRVCRNRLGDAHDAEDAFQATFLVLAQKAGSIRRSEAVAGWLLGVAGRVSAKARAADRRRTRAEAKAGIPPDLGRADVPPEAWTELYEEIERLPEKYRLPLILCYLEGLTYERAAGQLCCPVRTIQSRLARGRERLRGRLERRGLAPSAAIIGSAFSADPAQAIVSVSLREATATAALRFISGAGTAAGGDSAAALAGEVLRAMFIKQVGTIAKVALVLGLIASGGWLLARPGGATPPPSSPRPAGVQPAAPPQPAPAPRKEETPFRMTGTVRVEGTGEPVAGARVQVDLGTRDLTTDFHEAVTDANGQYTIPLPEGNARTLPSFFKFPTGYWLPEPARNAGFFAVTSQQPVHRQDYQVRRGTLWRLRLTRGPKQASVVQGSINRYHIAGDFNVSIMEKSDANGFATLTLPEEAAKITMQLAPKDRDGGSVLIKLDKSHGFRPGAVREVKRFDELDRAGSTALLIVDESGGKATVTGPVEASVTAGQLLLSASLPELVPNSFGNITGNVVEVNGRPIAGANIALYYAYRDWGTISGREEHKVRTDAQGRFVLRSVPKRQEGDPTRFSVVAYKDGYAGADTTTLVFQPGENGTQTVDPIPLHPGFSLNGRVVDPDGRPVVGAQVQAVEGWAQYANSYRSGPDGRFTIPNLGQGVIRAHFTFGPLIASGSYVVDGKGEPVTVQLQTPPKRPAVAAARPAPPRLLKAGEVAPNWVVRGWTDGKQRSLGELRGRVVCLDFWNLQSGARLLPVFDRLRQTFEPRGVVFLSIHTRDGKLDDIRKLYELKQVNLVSAVDEGPANELADGTTALMYGVRGHPWNFVIDRSGKVAFNSGDPANQVAMAAIVNKLGIDPAKQPTEEQMNQFVEAFLGEAIEKMLAQP
jgi:RNA polymerase sigma factor (sigma-70 family)